MRRERMSTVTCAVPVRATSLSPTSSRIVSSDESQWLPCEPVHFTAAEPRPERLGVHPHATGPLPPGSAAPAVFRASSITPSPIAHVPPG